MRQPDSCHRYCAKQTDSCIDEPTFGYKYNKVMYRLLRRIIATSLSRMLAMGVELDQRVANRLAARAGILGYSPAPSQAAGSKGSN